MYFLNQRHISYLYIQLQTHLLKQGSFFLLKKIFYTFLSSTQVLALKSYSRQTTSMTGPVFLCNVHLLHLLFEAWRWMVRVSRVLQSYHARPRDLVGEVIAVSGEPQQKAVESFSSRIDSSFFRDLPSCLFTALRITSSANTSALPRTEAGADSPRKEMKLWTGGFPCGPGWGGVSGGNRGPSPHSHWGENTIATFWWIGQMCKGSCYRRSQCVNKGTGLKWKSGEKCI